MAVAQIAIVGRPNVGKSSLLNWLAGRRIAIVDPTPGVTRDRVSARVVLDGRRLELVDTGGIGVQDVDNLTAEIERQIARAIDESQVVLFVVDVRAGVVPLDEEVARRLRGIPRPVVLVANKCDTQELEAQAVEFFRLGYGPPLCVSAQQGRGKPALVAAIVRHLSAAGAPAPSPQDEADEVALKLAIVGRRNTGKSTFINRLAREERMIVSEVPGTTRDSVDVRFERDGKVYLAIDTAGVRKKKSVKGDVEFYSLVRAQRSIRRADVVLLFLDARWKISRVDKQLADYILHEHKPAIFVVNKWDLVRDHIRTGEFGAYLRKIFPMLDYVPIAFISARTGHNVGALLKLADELHEQNCARVATPELNRVLRAALDESPPPMRQNRRPKVFYATQAAVQPPTIVLFTNGPELFDNTYQRYLLKTFRDQLPFGDIPIKLCLRSKKRAEEAPPEPAEAPPRRKDKASRAAPKRGKPAPPPQLWEDV